MRSFFQNNLSDMFENTDEECPNRPENQELGPTLGQNGDPDLIKLFPALLGPTKNPKKIKNRVTHAWKKYRKHAEQNALSPSLLTP